MFPPAPPPVDADRPYDDDDDVDAAAPPERRPAKRSPEEGDEKVALPGRGPDEGMTTSSSSSSSEKGLRFLPLLALPASPPVLPPLAWEPDRSRLLEKDGEEWLLPVWLPCGLLASGTAGGG